MSSFCDQNGYALTAEDVAGYGPPILNQDDLQANMRRHFAGGISSGRLRVDGKRSDAMVAGDASETFMTYAGEKMLQEIVRAPQTTTLMTPGPDALLPIRQELARGDTRIAYEIVTPTGSAAVADPMGMERLPDVGDFTEKVSHGSAWTGVGYGWGMTELWQALARARDIPTSRAANARSTLQRFNERVGLHGLQTHEIPGLLTQNQGFQFSMGANFNTITDPDVGLQVLQTIQHVFTRLAKSYSGALTNIIAPETDLFALQRLRYGANGEGDLMLDEARKFMPWLSMIRWIDGLETAGTTGGPLWLGWSADPGEFWNELGASPLLFGPFVDGGGLRTRFVLINHIGGPILRRRERLAAYSFAA